MPNGSETKIQFPKGFLIGAASSAHQVEGNNVHNDWWEYEQMGRLPKSGQAADHYHRFEEDFLLAKQMGLNAMRISIEWSRIEPLEGKWVVAEIEHYKKVLRKLKELGMTRMVTLHHYTLPQWLADRGGFETKFGVQAFARFAWFVAHNLGKEVDLWITINEPETYSFLSYKAGTWPPFKKSFLSMLRVIENLMRAHRAAYRAIKEVRPDAMVGLAKNSAYYEPYRREHLMDRLVSYVSTRINNHYLLEKVKKQLDFVGINYYFYRVVKFDWKTGFTLVDKPDVLKSDVGWQIDPEGIYYLLKGLKRYKKPIYVTESGIADAEDGQRADFIRQHLYWVKKAMDFGTDVRGYFYWSLTDTFEWEFGFQPKYGLIGVDLEAQTRTARASSKVLKEISFK